MDASSLADVGILAARVCLSVVYLWSAVAKLCDRLDRHLLDVRVAMLEQLNRRLDGRLADFQDNRAGLLEVEPSSARITPEPLDQRWHTSTDAAVGSVLLELQVRTLPSADLATAQMRFV